MVEGEKERIMRRSFALLAVLALVAAFGAEACGGSDEEKTTTQGTTPGAVSLEQDDFYFQPTTLKGEVGKPLQVALHNESASRAQHERSQNDRPELDLRPVPGSAAGGRQARRPDSPSNRRRRSRRRA